MHGALTNVFSTDNPNGGTCIMQVVKYKYKYICIQYTLTWERALNAYMYVWKYFIPSRDPVVS